MYFSGNSSAFLSTHTYIHVHVRKKEWGIHQDKNRKYPDVLSNVHSGGETSSLLVCVFTPPLRSVPVSEAQTPPATGPRAGRCRTGLRRLPLLGDRVMRVVDGRPVTPATPGLLVPVGGWVLVPFPLGSCLGPSLPVRRNRPTS